MNISEKKLSFRDALRSAFSIISKNKLSLINLYLAYFLIVALGLALSSGFLAILSFPGTACSIVGLFGVIMTVVLLGLAFLFGWNRIALALLDGKAVSSSMFLFSPREICHQFGAVCLNILMVLLGVICLIIPGLYLWIKFYFYDLVLADNPDMGAIEALKISSEIKTGRFWQVVRFLLLYVLFFALLSWFLSMLVWVPKIFFLLSPIITLLGLFMKAYAYRQLKSKEDLESLITNSLDYR